MDACEGHLVQFSLDFGHKGESVCYVALPVDNKLHYPIELGAVLPFHFGKLRALTCDIGEQQPKQANSLFKFLHSNLLRLSTCIYLPGGCSIRDLSRVMSAESRLPMSACS